MIGKYRRAARALFALLLLTTACSLHQDSPLPKLVAPDQAYTQIVPDQAIAYSDPGEWWLQLNDANLNQWMTKALRHNPSLLAAEARVEQRLASSDQSWSSLFPNLSLSSSQSQTKVGSGSSQTTSKSVAAALNSSYDLDLFGANSSALKAVEYDLLTAVEDYRVLLSSVSSQLAKAWFAHLETIGQSKLAVESYEANRVNYEWIEQNYRHGQALAADVLAAKEQMIGSKLLLLNLQSLKDQQLNQLYLIAGETPKNTGPEGSFPVLSALPELATGLPSELLQRRPTVKRAMLAIQAQDHRVAAAVAARFPRLSLSAQVGYSSTQAQGLTDSANFISNLASNLTLPILDMGGRRAEVRRQEKILAERLADYQQSLLSAVVEVENALAKNRIGKERLGLLSEQENLAQERLALTKKGFVQGINRWDQVLTAQTQYDNYKKSKLAEQKSWLESRIDLYTALGGNWTAVYWKSNHQEIQSQIEEEP